MDTEFAPLFKLGRAERIQLVEDLWDSIALEDGAAPVSPEQIAELRRRKERFTGSGLSWDQVKQRARSSDD